MVWYYKHVFWADSLSIKYLFISMQKIHFNIWCITMILFCHPEIPFRRHRAWHPSCNCIHRHRADLLSYPFHGCGRSHWKPQLPVWMSWVWPDIEMLSQWSVPYHELQTQVLWHGNPIHCHQACHSCFTHCNGPIIIIYSASCWKKI